MSPEEIEEIIRLNKANIDYADIYDLDVREMHGYNMAINNAIQALEEGK